MLTAGPPGDFILDLSLPIYQILPQKMSISFLSAAFYKLFYAEATIIAAVFKTLPPFQIQHWNNLRFTEFSQLLRVASHILQMRKLQHSEVGCSTDKVVKY